MTVGTDQPKIAREIVTRITINVVKLKWDRFACPLSVEAHLTLPPALGKQMPLERWTLSDLACFYLPVDQVSPV